MPTDKTNSRLSEISARMNAATAGPWALWDGFKMSDGDYSVLRVGPNDSHSGIRSRTSLIGTKADLEFVACAHADVEWLVERLREMIINGTAKDQS